VKDAAFGSHDKFPGSAFLNIFQQGCGRSDVPGKEEHRFFAFRMRDEFGIGMKVQQFHDFLRRKLLMHHAGAIPQHHVSAGNAVYIISEVFVGSKDQRLIRRKTFHDFHRIGRCADYVGHGFEIGRTVDVGDNLMSGISGLELREFFCRGRFRQGATCLQVGKEHLFRRTQDLGRLSHEMNADKYDDVSMG